MRPVRLELKGFTSFRDDQAIDFDGLDLFAIAGPTGSGKSSILDAITYALYGYVDRVGKQVAQLVSQGQPRMAVMLQFGVGEDRYRVARSTPAHGASKILLERWQDGEWRQAGEGADRVREADAMIRQAIGLDYQAFTRSVLLPQGKFAEFLVGDAKDRRNILTELLGLELFERLAKLAGEIKRVASAEADANERLLSTEYAGVTDEAVAQAAAVAAEAAAREEKRFIRASATETPSAPSWPNGAQVCEVEVDPETGSVEVVAMTSVDDIGRIINHMIVEGQIHGGIAQGIGQALFEHARYDAASGQLLTGSLMDYCVPRADQMPPLRTRFDESVPCKTNLLGVKGCGEIGTIGAVPAVVHAVLDALAEKGVAHLDMPLTPEKVWRALAARA